MRLRKPNLVPQASTTIPSSPFATPEMTQIQKSTLIDPTIESTGLTSLAALPNGFGSMFVGTDFLAYVSLNNESDEEVHEVQVAAEIRAPQNRYPLKPKLVRVGAAKDYTTEEKHKLIPGEALHIIFDHSIYHITRFAALKLLKVEANRDRSETSRRTHIGGRGYLSSPWRRTHPHLSKNVQFHDLRNPLPSKPLACLSPTLRSLSNPNPEFRRFATGPQSREFPSRNCLGSKIV